jgi:hypothetical protein
MKVSPNTDMHIDVRAIGREGAPLAVIDNLVSEPDTLVAEAGRWKCQSVPRAYPGMRAAASGDYEQFLLEALRSD